MADNAEQIVDAIISDLTGRAGLGNEFEGCDSGIQAEIRETWIEIVRNNGK